MEESEKNILLNKYLDFAATSRKLKKELFRECKSSIFSKVILEALDKTRWGEIDIAMELTKHGFKSSDDIIKALRRGKETE